MDEEDQERRRKLEAGKAKLAQFRQRKGQTDSQASAKKSKKKKTSSGSKHREQPEEIPEVGLSQSDETPSQTAPSGASTTAEFTIMRTMPHGEMIQHDKTYTIEPESEVSTTADDYSSEVVDGLPLTANNTAHTPWEEEFEVRETFCDRGTQSALSRLEVMEDELVGKQQEIEELNRELEEMRGAYGTEGLQQLQEFETAIKQRDGIITQLTTNLQQARKEKDDTAREFLELTEQSQKLKIQFQHMQASESLRNTSHSSTAVDLLHSKQQIITYQQQLEERDHRLRLCQKEIEDFRAHVTSLQDQVHEVQQVQKKELEFSYEQKLNEKDLLLDSLKSTIHNEEIKSLELKERIAENEKSIDGLKAQLTQKSQEIGNLSEELNSSRQKERRSSDEIKQLMGTVEDLQKKHYRDSQSEAGLLQRIELETQRKLEQLQAELDEVHGQEIVQMKQELVKQHTLATERLLAQHRQEVSSVMSQAAISTSTQQINELNVIISELNARLQQSDEQRDKMKEDFSHRIQATSKEKSQLQMQIEDLLQDLSYAREQVHKARESLTEKENKLNAASSLFVTIDNLKAELATANEFTKELESKHEAEVTNYKIKLEMLEREKDEVLDRMAESQEAEFEKLRTHFLFSQEEELTKLKEDLTREHRTNIENLKDNLEVQYKKQMDQMKQETSQTITAMQSEKDSLITKQNYLMLEISKLKDLLQSVNDPNSEQMMMQINELQKELECMRREEKEKGTMEQEVQALQLRIETLEKEVIEKDTLKQKVASLETDNRLLKDQYDVLKARSTGNCENLTDSESSDLKNMIERLTSENAQLRNLEHQLREEIERQKNTFSFAEKNFEVNYNELKEEYSCLVKLKEQLEDGKAKLEDEYKTKLDSLNNEIVKLKRGPQKEAHLIVSGASNLVKADRSEDGEVVEKDTTELMEKLETAQRDKQELSLKLSDLSEELQLKQNEISQLKEQVQLLWVERDTTKIEEVVLELDSEPIHRDGNIPVHTEHSTECSLVVSDDASHSLECLTEETIHPTKVHLSPQTYSSNQESVNILIERESLLQRIDELTRKLEEGSFILESTHLENKELQQKLDTVLQEKADTALQLEAQRISLTQINKAQLELINENVQSEKKSELCSLRETLLRDQEEKTRGLRDQHQRELERLQPQHTGCEEASCQDLTQRLMKRVCDESADIIQVVLGKEREQENRSLQERREEEMTYSTSLSLRRTTVQTLQSNLSTLLEKFVEEYKQMADLSTYIGKTADLPVNREQPDIPQVKQIVIISQDSAPSQSDVQERLTIPPSEEAEKLKAKFRLQRAQLEEKHSGEIEYLRSYFQQQLKENEERFSKEIIHLQERLQDVSVSPLPPRDLCANEPGAELGFQEETIFQSVYHSFAEILKVEETAQMGDSSLRTPIGPIYQELQSLRQALFSKYVAEVIALKKQHKAELDQLRVDLTENFSVEKAALRQEIVQLTRAKQETVNGGFQPSLCPITEEKSDADLSQLLEERYQEKIEQEIARVIVEMSIAFAQQTELARLSSLEVAEEQNFSQDQTAAPEQDADSQTPDAQEELEQEGIQLKDLPVTDTSDVDLDVLQQEDPTPGQQDTKTETKTQPKERPMLLKEEEQSAVMGAEATKYKQMYEERVEEMRQELVRQEQEYQQAAEALRLAHAAQLERQMYDQEQLLSEVHRLREQLTENASVISEKQAIEREKLLLEELESMKRTCAEVTGRTRDCILRDGSSQTQDEPVADPEKREQVLECGEEEKGLEESETEDPSSERKSLRRVNKRLLKILLEIVKTTGAVEETIGRHVVGLLDKSGRRSSTSKVVVWNLEQGDLQATSAGTVTVIDADGAEACSGLKDEVLWSEDTEEDLDVPLELTEADFPGTGFGPEEEAQVLNISGRLQSAVEKLLEAINETSNQLEHAKAAQTELVRESLKRKQETTDLLRCQEELQERLNEEAKATEHLALELSKAEGLLDGYTDERVFLEKQMQEKNDLIRHLEQELQSTGNRLQELEQERQQMQEEKELLSRQKLALKASAAPAEQRLVEAAAVAAPKEELLEETEKLLKEKIEVQRQAEKDSGDLHKQVKVLEVELEEQVSHNMEMEQEKNTILEDLRQKNLSLEKQLEKTRRFLDEQAIDREHERDVFQQEIQKLEQQLKMPQRHQPVNEHQSNEVEKLESHLKEKTDKCSELLLCKEQLQRDVHERNEEIEKLECRIRELEQALLISADTLQKVEDRRPSLVGAKGEMPLEAQLQVEREAIDRKEKEVTNLVEQLEQFREELENKNEEVQQLHMQLEIQRKESATRLQELEQENKVLKDELEITPSDETSSTTGIPVGQGKMDDLLLSKDQEILLLSEQIRNLQVQLEAATDNKEIEEKNEKMKQYKSQIKCLKSDQERLKKNSEEEIEKLNEVIEKLQEELSFIEPKVTVSFTSMAEITGSNTYQDADLPPLAEHADLNVDNTVLDNEECEKEEQFLTSPRVAQSSVSDIETSLQQLQETIKDKDLNLKKYYEQIMTLKEETKVLHETMERLRLELAEKDQNIKDTAISKNLTSSISLETSTCPPLDRTDETFINHELEATKAELKRVKEELEKLRTSTENTISNELAVVKTKEEIDINSTASIENLTEALREKTAQRLTVEALFESVQETSQNTIYHLQCQVQDLQKTVQEKESQLQELANKAQVFENQEAQRLNEVIKKLQLDLTEVEGKISEASKNTTKDGESQTTHNETPNANAASLHQKIETDDEKAVLSKEVEDAKKELTLLKEELKHLRKSKKHSDKPEGNGSREDGTRHSDLDVTDPESSATKKTVQAVAGQSLPADTEKTTPTTEINMESQLQELKEVIKRKDLELLQYINQKDLLHDQAQKIELLNEEIGKLKQDLAEESSDLKINATTSLVNSKERLENIESDELAQAKAELEKREIELAVLVEELTNLRMAQKHDDVTIESCSTQVDVAKAPLMVTDLEQALKEKAAELFESQMINVSLEETTRATLHAMDLQLQELQKVVKQKDLELEQYVQQKDLLHDQAQIIEQLNEEIRKQKQDLAEASSDFKINATVGSVHSKEMLENKENDELNQTKAELEKKEMELAALTQERSKLQMAQKHDDVTVKSSTTQIEVDKTALAVADLEQALNEKAAELLESQKLNVSLEETTRATIHKMELQLQELQKVVELKDLDLLQYFQKKDQQKKEVDQLNEIIRTLQQELAQSGSDCEKVLPQKNELEREELMQTKAELEKAKTDLAVLQEDLSKGNLAKQYDSVSNGNTSREGEAAVTDLEQALREKTAELLESQAMLVSLDETTQATIHSLESNLQELQKTIQLKDSELMQYVNQKGLIDHQTKEIERLNNLASMDMHNSEDTSPTVRNGEEKSTEALQELLLQNKASLDGSELMQTKAELEKTKMELAAMSLEISKIRLSQKNEDMPDGNTPKEGEVVIIAHKVTNLEQALMEKTADLLASQTLLTSLEETSQTTIHNMESQLQELKRAVQLKDSELLQYLNQQNILNQQTKEIEHLSGVIDSLQKQLEAAQQRTSVQESKSKKLETEQMNGGEMTFIRTLDAKAEREYEEPFGQLYSARERIHTLDSGKRMSDGDVTAVMENEDQCDWMIEALRDQNTELLASQSLFTETMQNTIDSLETQLEELQKVVKEKDMEILLYLEEVEILKEQVKVKTNEHDQIMLAMEDSLREKVAAALVSEAQLKAIQLHTKRMHADDRSSPVMEESKILQTHGPNLSQEGEFESKSAVLNLQPIELGKQLSDLHEQLRVERDQVIFTNQLAAEKEKQLVELQQLLKSPKGKQSVTWASTETRDGALLQGRSTKQSREITDLENQLQTLTEEAIATKEELCHYREMSEKLREELMVNESRLVHLEKDFREVKKCLSNAEEKLAFYMKREIQEEELQSMSDIDLPHVRSPDWTTLDRTTSYSQTDRIPSVNNSNQTSQIPRKHVGVQNELETGLSSSSDEVAELMEQYTEKISQMQELHAAEILDMESRHISESESLRSEQYTVVQALTDECDALKAVIEALKSPGGGVPDSVLSTSYHLTDATSSDVGTECDWSQGTYDAQSFDQIPEGLRVDEDDIHTELIPSKIKDLLRAVHQEGMQVLSLTEATSPEKEPTFTVKTQPWHEERKSMLETIASLKDLIAKMQIHKDSEAHTRPGFHDLRPDWRGEMLRAIQEVFQREQDVLMSAFHSQLASLGKCDANALLNQMQHRLEEQGMEQINAMDCIQNADRRSLLLEIQDLRAQLSSLHNDPGIQSLFHPNREAGALYIHQEQAAHSQELHMQLMSMEVKAGELQEQLGSERLLAAEIKSELALTKMELESNLKLQHKHFKELEALRMELKKKREELDRMNEALANEQKKCRELQFVLEKEQTKGKLKELQEKEDVEDFQILLDEQKLKNLEISKQLEEERKLVKDLQEQMESTERAHDAVMSQERSRVLELQVFLDAEKARSAELSSTLECRQDLRAHVQNTETDGQSGGQPADDVLKELQGQLDNKHGRIVELVNEVEGYKLECVQLRQNLEEERHSLKKELEAEQEASRLAGKQVEELTVALEGLQQQVQERATEIRRHQAEERQLRETIQRLQNSAQDHKDSACETKEPAQSSVAVRSSPTLGRSTVQPRTGSPPNLLCPDPLSVVSGDPGIEGASFSIDYIKRRLQQVAAKLRQLAAKSSQRVLFERADDEDLAWSQNSIQEILSQMEHVAILSLQGQKLVLPSGISANTLTEKLLTQNAELTGYVSRLTEEKKDLQNSLLRLEGEVSHYRAREPSRDHSPVDNFLNTDTLLVTEREAWSREKLSLHKSLKQTEAELSKVKSELRNEVMQRDFGRGTENTTLKRVYGKYLRSESFRKALIYQKKYLLLLLGGFQECEEATLALIARMGGHPTYTDLEVITNHSRAFTRFRSAARVTIAIFRMKFLVRRWHRATISTTSGTDRNSCGQGAGETSMLKSNEVSTDSACHPARSLERISTCRSQSGFNSPQSTVNSQHRYTSASDASPCFHLQHYDPDRALTDYITRLEALQKRLGSVQSGSSANTTHYSIRR
ncbi:A-kinase anchor protein 9 isoform X3 [Rana temporaria]|uniref:A-kinase anchor protein 9 isoform X3 n=1 Tax=Rana temporaria TaxID=8407 RepID=UPI001AAD81B6|nr:A-kinase anchor protein 9 isoform X3 [Rana temporaria]